MFTVYSSIRCDRILSYRKGMRQLNYRRTELKLSDHRPVTATYMAEVEVLSPRKLQRALTFTDAEIENEDIITDIGPEIGIGGLKLAQVSSFVILEIGKDLVGFFFFFFDLFLMNNRVKMCTYMSNLAYAYYCWASHSVSRLLVHSPTIYQNSRHNILGEPDSIMKQFL